MGKESTPCCIMCKCSCVDSASPWAVALQALTSMGFSRHEYWSGCHFFSRGVF